MYTYMYVCNNSSSTSGRCILELSQFPGIMMKTKTWSCTLSFHNDSCLSKWFNSRCHVMLRYCSRKTARPPHGPDLFLKMYQSLVSDSTDRRNIQHPFWSRRPTLDLAFHNEISVFVWRACMWKFCQQPSKQSKTRSLTTGMVGPRREVI